MTAETSNARGGLRAGIDRLWDSQWVNIVNSPEVLNAIRNRDYEVAVGVAIRMTEKKMAENFAAALSQQPEAQQPAAPSTPVGVEKVKKALERLDRTIEACAKLTQLLGDGQPHSDLISTAGGQAALAKEAIQRALAQQPADVVVDDTRGRAK